MQTISIVSIGQAHSVGELVHKKSRRDVDNSEGNSDGLEWDSISPSSLTQMTRLR